MASTGEQTDTEYVRERLDAIQETEQRLVSFLGTFAEVMEKVEETHVELLDKEAGAGDGDGDGETVQQLMSRCYEDLSFASVHLRRELKLLEVKLPLPAGLSKKASDVNNEKLRRLL
ncbi:hypothetical protein PICMEDRAFT_74925 [Pichia membranifaciens NRRL Y-2026]|uniref:Mediator of RNA polymerase II transcription subunit 11 n=1 Tax=Pichia membranifaciens NRRL Y-2026 TaxID=763406 RepID=A0A1E3ND91_9ASCO|nr:hypothetical protein PICMEDRAFT_74925 [Pichia membranifaciens NRRL Y-2026]ODQ44087.1 hypothetical protein PICMEDRAFT_74925 [Pichia membranifaciens NRRL Y-2026]